MSFSIGIVGLPNVGKSTLFKALTRQAVDASNYPFCTIDPNIGVVKVPDDRLEALHKLYPTSEIIPTAIEFVDIAGLVKGASEGEGLGNKFLANIRDVDAIAQVVRAFENPDITHVAGQVDPENDASTINTELILADLETVAKRLKSARDDAKDHQNKAAQKLVAALERIEEALNNNRLASTVQLDEEEEKLIKELRLLTKKSLLYVLNVSEESLSRPFEKPGWIPQEIGAVLICAKVESELADLSPEEAKVFLRDLGLEQSGLEQLIKESYKLLDLITFLTAGPKECRAWTIKRGTKAPQAAGRIHTDFEKGFIRLEVINWKDLVEAGSEPAAREKGLIRIEGKDYVMQDGDTCHFLFNV